VTTTTLRNREFKIARPQTAFSGDSSERPVRPSLPFNTLLGTLLGLTLFGGAAVAIESFRELHAVNRHFIAEEETVGVAADERLNGVLCTSVSAPNGSQHRGRSGGEALSRLATFAIAVMVAHQFGASRWGSTGMRWPWPPPAPRAGPRPSSPRDA